MFLQLCACSTVFPEPQVFQNASYLWWLLCPPVYLLSHFLWLQHDQNSKLTQVFKRGCQNCRIAMHPCELIIPLFFWFFVFGKHVFVCFMSSLTCTFVFLVSSACIYLPFYQGVMMPSFSKWRGGGGGKSVKKDDGFRGFTGPQSTWLFFRQFQLLQALQISERKKN